MPNSVTRAAACMRRTAGGVVADPGRHLAERACARSYGAPAGVSRSQPEVPQLPLALRHSPDQRLETFVRAPAGVLEQLRALAQGSHQVPGQPAPDALYMAGPGGVGKTH